LVNFFVLDGEEKSNINQELITNHHAVAYHGQSKKEIEEAHLVNRTFFK